MMAGREKIEKRFHEGHSTPRPFRCNDKLWRAFRDVAEKYGMTPTAAMRHLMEKAVQAHGVPPVRVSARRKRRLQQEMIPDIIIVSD